MKINIILKGLVLFVLVSFLSLGCNEEQLDKDQNFDHSTIASQTNIDTLGFYLVELFNGINNLSEQDACD